MTNKANERNNMKLDEDQRTMINLEVMAKITKNDHLRVDQDELLSIDNRYCCGVRRWAEGTTSDQTIGCIYNQISYVYKRLSDDKSQCAVRAENNNKIIKC